MNKQIMETVYGKDSYTMTQLSYGKCPFCGKPTAHIPFRDELSRKEATISHLCQPCQDGVFGGPEEEI